MLALLASARIRAEAAVSAARALFDAGWTTPRKMAAATWEERIRCLNRAGYARYDERTSRMLADTSNLLLERYRGDLRRLRDEAGRDPESERRLLRAFKGIGDVGVDIFFREAQLVWEELRPFADRRALDAAEALGLGSDARALERATSSPEELTRLVAGLVRANLAGDLGELTPSGS